MRAAAWLWSFGVRLLLYGMKDGAADMTRQYNKVAFDVVEGKIYPLETKKAAEGRVKVERHQVKAEPRGNPAQLDAYLNRRKL